MYKERILIVHNYYQIPGGEDIVVENEKKMLEDNGHEVFMYTRDNKEINEKGILGKLLLPFETIYSLKTIKEIKKVIMKYDIDIVHVHNTFPLISPSVYKISKKLGVRVVQTIHNFRLLCPAGTFVRDNKICEDCVSKGLLSSIKNNCYRNSKIQTIIIALMLKLNRSIGSYKKVDIYIALTKFNKIKLSSLIDKEKIFIKPNFCQNYNIPIVPVEKRKYIIFLGRLDKLKGINLLVQAWKDIKEEQLLIVGTGPEEENLKKYIKENNISNIKLVGYKRKNEAMELLSKAKALIFPSQWYETFGLVLIEALNLDIPVIANNIGGISEIINHTNHGIVESINSKEDIKILINRFVSNYNDFNNVKKDLKEAYNIEENYKILIEIYSNIK